MDVQDDGRPKNIKDKQAAIEEKTRFHGKVEVNAATGRSWVGHPGTIMFCHGDCWGVQYEWLLMVGPGLSPMLAAL